MEAEIDRLVAMGYWTPVTESEWATPLIPVVKPDGGIRLCGDYKVTVNPQLAVAQHPLPTNEDLFSKLGNCSIFSKIDLCRAFQQLELEDSSREMCTVNTSKGLYKVNRLPYGIASSPALWQRTVDTLFKGLDGVLCFVDDILVAGKDHQSHNRALESVFKILDKYNLHIKPEKCIFATDEVSYLGFKISKTGIHKTKDKIAAIVNSKTPTSVAELRSFLGLINFYKKFFPDLATVAAPLYTLLKKDIPFIWGPSQDGAFSRLRGELSSDRFLTHYRPDLPLRLSCDASAYGLGAVLSHVVDDGRELPIAYASRSLNKAEKLYSQVDKEALAIIYAVQHFHFYLYGRLFSLVTDHRPLLSILGEKSSLPQMVAARLQRYAVILSTYHYKIMFRSSADHGNADALSRMVEKNNDTNDIDFDSSSSLMVNFIKSTVSCQEISDETKRDPLLSKVYKCLLDGTDFPLNDQFVPFRTNRLRFNLDGGLILRDSRVVIPVNLQSKILDVLHEEHVGINKTKALARSYVWWHNIDKDIENRVRTCKSCQIHGNNPVKTPIHSWETPAGPWDRLHIDFAGPVNNTMFMVIVDAFSKWPEVFLMKETTSSNCIKILESLFARFGFPLRIVSDNGPQFTSREFSEFLRTYGISHSLTAPYKPATNGEAERFVQTLKNFLKVVSLNSTNSDELQSLVSSFLLTYRTTPHAVTHSTPSELLLKRNVRNVLDVVKPSRELSSNVGLYPNVQVRSFEVGDAVMRRCFVGKVSWVEGTIMKRLGKLHYLVKSGHRLVKCHVDQLKKCHGLIDHVIGDRDPYELSEHVSLGEAPTDIGVAPGPDSGGSLSVQSGEDGIDTAVTVRSKRNVKPPDRLNL